MAVGSKLPTTIAAYLRDYVKKVRLVWDELKKKRKYSSKLTHFSNSQKIFNSIVTLLIF